MTSLKTTAISTYMSKVDRLIDSEIPTLEEMMMVTVFDPKNQQWKISPIKRRPFIVRLKLCLKLLFDKNVRLVKIQET